MKNHIHSVYLQVLLVLLASIVFLIMILPGVRQGNEIITAEYTSAYGSDTARAKVLSIIEEGNTVLGNVSQQYQIFEVEILDGKYPGQQLTVDYGLRQIVSVSQKIHTGETILISVGERPDTGEVRAFFTDFERSRPILILFLLFVFVSVLMSGWKGVRSIVSIIFSLIIIVFYIMPQILAGHDPVWISISGAFVFLSISQYLVYGWNLKTHSAVIGILLSLIITGILSAVFVNFTRLTGFGDENALFLTQMTITPINMRGLLLAGMLIGALGVLDDLVISQASAVFELRAANETLNFRFLFKRAMNIGKDHVAATVNTLVLAYAGASLPMLLLFSISNQDPAMLINISFIAEEIVRTLVGSIGLIISIPITTAIAAYIAANYTKFPWINDYFGPENQWSQFHTH
jgi:uncharacterized membrane protein